MVPVRKLGYGIFYPVAPVFFFFQAPEVRNLAKKTTMVGETSIVARVEKKTPEGLVLGIFRPRNAFASWY